MNYSNGYCRHGLVGTLAVLIKHESIQFMCTFQHLFLLFVAKYNTNTNTASA